MEARLAVADVGRAPLRARVAKPRLSKLGA